MKTINKKSDKTQKVTGIHYQTGTPVCIEYNEDEICEITEIAELSLKDRHLIISPGLIDNQINGYANVDFSGGNLSEEDVIFAAKAIWREGVTSFLPTLITNSHDNLIKNLSILNRACTNDEMLSKSVPGFHLEGPYLSPEEGFFGCHPVEYLRNPSWKEFSEYREASGGRIIQVTIAPELKGALEFIKKCKDEGIIVAIGHTNASAEQISQAVKNGAVLSTHLGNGCANYIHRHNNPIWPQLANDGLVASIIADGHHLLPEEIKVFCKAKGADRIILTSDVMYLAGMTPGIYLFSGMEVRLKENGMLLNEKLNCLAGASFPLRKGVENIMEFTGCTLTEAIKFATLNVAGIYNLSGRGDLKPGNRADIILFKRTGNQIQIMKTILAGKIVYNAKL